MGSRPARLFPLTAAPPFLRLTALVLAAHPSPWVHHNTVMDVPVHPCGHSPYQSAALLDGQTTTYILTAWRHRRDTDEFAWRLSHERPPALPALAPGSNASPAELEQETSPKRNN